MWHSGRRIANASAPWPRWRCARHAAAAAPFAGHASGHWTPNLYQASHGYLKLATADSTDASRLAKQSKDGVKDSKSTLQYLRHPIIEPSPMAQLAHDIYGDPRDDPVVPFDQSKFHFLAGYSPSTESIKLYLGSDVIAKDRTIELSKFYLRHICQCSECVCPSTGQKTFAACDVPDVPRLREPDTESIRLSADGGLEITWEDDFLTGDTHTSVYPREFLTNILQHNGRTNSHFLPLPFTWDYRKFQRDMDSRVITYRAWMEDGPEFAHAVLDLYKYGLIFMRGVPKSRHSVQRLAERLGSIQSTLHGLTWDVISKPDSENVASLNEHFHQDLVYSDNMPQIKLLHCLDNDFEGDVSLFSDGLNAAWELKSKDRPSYAILGSQLVTYNYQQGGQYLRTRRRVIATTPGSIPSSIAWSPAFQGPFRVFEHRTNTPVRAEPGPEGGELRAWSRAARVFRDELESPSNVVHYKQQPGDCIIFDNSRIVHGSKQLVIPAGRRHLRGAYVDSQTLTSAFSRLIEQGLLPRSAKQNIIIP